MKRKKCIIAVILCIVTLCVFTVSASARVATGTLISKVDCNIRLSAYSNPSGDLIRIGYEISGLEAYTDYYIDFNLNIDVPNAITTYQGQSLGNYYLGYCMDYLNDDNISGDLGIPNPDYDFGFGTISADMSGDYPITLLSSTSSLEYSSVFWCPDISNMNNGTFQRYKISDYGSILEFNNDGIVVKTSGANATGFVGIWDLYMNVEIDREKSVEIIEALGAETSIEVYSLKYDDGGDGGNNSGDGGVNGDYGELDGVDFLGWLGNSVSGFLGTPIFGNVSLGSIVWFIIGLCAFFAVLKYFAG